MHQTHLRPGAVSLRGTLEQAQFFKSRDVIAGSCSSDWRSCQPGDVFFAVTTANDDGHEHVDEALAAGVSAVVAERLLPVDCPQVLVGDSRVAFARVCQALAGNPSRELKTIGICGTAGKSVTAMLVASVLEAAGQAAGVVSSIGNSDSLDQQSATGQSPTAAEFATWLGRMSGAGCDAGVVELSSQALAENRACGIELDAAVLTNIKGGHRDGHNTARAYQEIQRRIFNQLKTGGIAVVNADDHRCRSLIDTLASPCLTYALHTDADITATVLERFPSEQTFLLFAGSDSAPVRTRMIGDHHVSNCLATAAVGLALGIDLQAIIRGLEAVERVPCRMERLECGQPFSVFVDAADSPETLSLAIKTVRQVTRGRVLTVFGPRGKLDPARRALIGRVLERGAHVPIITSGEPRQSQPLREAHDVLDGFERPHKAQVIPDRTAAIRFALANARAGDTVLIAGWDYAGADISGNRQAAYDDREVACECLYSPGERQVGRPRFRVVG